MPAGLVPVGIHLSEGYAAGRVTESSVPVFRGRDLISLVRDLRADTVAVCGSARSEPGDLRRLAWQLEGTGVDLVVAGHNHVYERSVKIRGDQEADDGITYLVTGGAGADLYQGFTGEWFGAMDIALDPIDKELYVSYFADNDGTIGTGINDSDSYMLLRSGFLSIVEDQANVVGE